MILTQIELTSSIKMPFEIFTWYYFENRLIVNSTKICKKTAYDNYLMVLFLKKRVRVSIVSFFHFFNHMYAN